MMSQSSLTTRSRQVAQHLRRQIRSGRWEVGATLPSSRRIAADHGISINTAQAVLRQLEGENLILCRPRRKPIVKAHRSDVGVRRANLVTMITPTGPAVPRDRHVAPDIFFAAEHVLTEAGYVLSNLPQKLVGGNPRPAIIQRIETMEDDLAGAIVLTHNMEGQLLADDLQARSIPTVQIDRLAESRTHNYVTPAFGAGAQAVGRMFAALDCRRVLFVLADRMNLWHKQQLTGLVQGYLDLDKPLPTIDRIVGTGAGSENIGRNTTEQYIAANGAPDAVFASGDYVAKGAVAALEAAGLRVPDDVNVIGATGLEVAGHFTPPLTVLGRPLREMGEAAGRMMIKLINEPSRVFEGQEIPCVLALRQTVRITDAVGAALRQCTDVRIEDETDGKQL